MAWAYVLRGSKGRLYVGCTENLEQRLNQHRAGLVHSTKRMGTLELVSTREFETLAEAVAFERFLKSRKDPKRILWYMEKGKSSPA